MIQDFWLVLSNPRDGRHTEFNDWYDNIHVRDIIRQPGATGAERLRLDARQIEPCDGFSADRSFGYLALYDVDDAARVAAGQATIFSPAMQISDSFDFAASGAFYTPLAVRNNRLEGSHLVIETMAASNEAGFAEAYAEGRMAALARLPGVASSMLASYADFQMFPPQPASHFVALYRVADPAAVLDAWTGVVPLPLGASARVSCFAPLMPRIGLHDVLNPGEAAAAAESRARVTMGDRVHRAFPETGGPNSDMGEG